MNRISNKKGTGIKKALSSLLAAVMVVSCFPAYALANDTDPATAGNATVVSQEEQDTNTQSKEERAPTSSQEGVSRDQVLAPSTGTKPSDQTLTGNGLGRNDQLVQNQLKSNDEILAGADYILTLTANTKGVAGQWGKEVFSSVRDGSGLTPFFVAPTTVQVPTGEEVGSPISTLYVKKDAKLKLQLKQGVLGSFQWMTSSNLYSYTPILETTPGYVLGTNAVMLDTSKTGVQYYYASGINGTETSTLMLKVTVINPTVSVSSSSTAFEEGGTATLTASDSGFPTGIGFSKSYSWSKDGKQLVGENQSTLSITNLSSANAGAYTCTVVATTDAGWVTESSNAVQITVAAPKLRVSIAATPESGVLAGGNVTLTANVNNVAGATYAYSWTGPTADTIYGAEQTLTLNNVTLANSGKYTCNVTRTLDGNTENNFASYELMVNESAFEVKVKPSEEGQTGSGGHTYEFGQALTLRADFTQAGDRTYTYQWYKGTEPISEATQDSLAFASLKTTDSGTYRVDVRVYQGEQLVNSGSASFQVAVTAEQKPVVVIENSTGSDEVLEGAPVTLTAVVSGSGKLTELAYQWTKVHSGSVGTSRTYAIDKMSAAHTGMYTVEVTGKQNGTSFSQAAVAYLVNFKSTATTLNTADTNNLVDLKVFNYSKEINYAMDTLGGLAFINGAMNGVDGTYIVNVPDNTGVGAYQGLMKPNLGTDGLPVLTNGNKSANYLFGSGDTEYRKTYDNANYLLQKQGSYYSYDSQKNHAAFDTNTRKFTVWNFLLAPQGGSGYFPFSKEKAAQDGDLVITDSYKTDFWFGTSMAFKFMQPGSGMIDQESMKFEFSGDDDVWIYIDDKLFLDLGGIHARVEGNIDFAAGTVMAEVYAGNNSVVPKVVTFEELLTNAGIAAADMGDYLVKDSVTGEYTTFKNYSEHTLKFFYLERGAGESNCMMKFNLPPVPQNSINVVKQLENVNPSLESSLEFDFQLKLNNQIGAGRDYTVTKNGSPVRTGTTGTNGEFVLKHGEMASFEGLAVTDEFEIIETGVPTGEYEDIIIDGFETSGSIPEEGEDGTFIGVSTGVRKVGDVKKTIVFKNVCHSTNNMKDLVLTKQVEGDTNQDSFQFDVAFDGKSYAGMAYVTKKGSTAPERVFVSAKNPLTLQAGDTARIDDIPARVSYQVTEHNPTTEETTYLTPTVATSGENGILGTAADATISGGNYSVSGKMYLGYDGLVQFTNKSESKKVSYHTVVVNKTIDQMVGLQGDPIFFFRLENTTTGEVYYRQVRFADKNTQTATFENLPTGSYVLTEEQPMRFDYKSVSASGQNATVSANTQQGSVNITFDKKVAGLVTANYSNTYEKPYYFTDTDLVTNKIQIKK